MGAVEPGIVGLTVGTSGVVFATTPSALIEPEGRLHAFCHAVPGLWHFMGVMLSAAGSLQWYRDSLAPGMGFDELLKEAESAPAGSEGLQFLPYLSGERTPYPDPLARGAFVGLTVRHGRAHMTRAVLEGVSFGLKDSFTLIQEAGLGAIKQVRASGGGTKGALWRQILASVLEAELVTVNTTEGAGYGAALLAGVGAGRLGRRRFRLQSMHQNHAEHTAGRVAGGGLSQSVSHLSSLVPGAEAEFRQHGFCRVNSQDFRGQSQRIPFGKPSQLKNRA